MREQQITKSMWSIRQWCRPSKKALFIVPAAFLCLLCLTVLSLDCLTAQDQSFLCPIFFNKHDTAFEPFAYGIEESTDTEMPTAILDSNGFVIPIPAVDYTNSLMAPAFDDTKSLIAPSVDDTNSLIAPSVDDTNSLIAPAIDNGLVSTSPDNSNQILQHEDKIDVTKLQRKLDDVNNKQIVSNLDKFGPITNDTIVIVIKVRQRLEHLQALLASLERAKYIERTLLVFSHGFYSEEINNAVQNTEFAKFIQVFFPYSLQTHPNTFPGFSPGDCPYGATKEEIKKIQCHSQPRNVESLQEKHSWWWTVNMVFSGLRITKDFTGLVLFLEEDHYVFPDFLHVLRLMRNIPPKKCPGCNMLGLGLSPKYVTIEDYREKADKVHSVQWNNVGYAFDRQFWSGLNSQRCSDMFCEYNDYNWDFTLAYLSHKCLPHKLKPLNVLSSRIFHFGDCEVNFNSKDCSFQTFREQMDNLQRDVSQFMFPPELTVLSTHHHHQKMHRHKGGWDDPRDIQLCKNFSQQLRW